MGGFAYKRKQNKKGEEVGGIVPYIPSSTIANEEPSEEEVLVDRPESENKITRVTGPFCVEGTIPTPVDISAGAEDGGLADSGFRSGFPATYIQATPDLMMGDLLKNMRSSQIFSVCGLPEIKIHRVEKGRAAAGRGAAAGVGSRIPDSEFRNVQYEVELLGLDVFDPVTMETNHRSGNDVPAWFLDADYNGLCFHVSQAFFPRTSAGDNLKKSLKSEFEESVWDHLSGTKSAPFEAGDNRQIAVKVIDDRGNELMVVEKLR